MERFPNLSLKASREGRSFPGPWAVTAEAEDKKESNVSMEL